MQLATCHARWMRGALAIWLAIAGARAAGLERWLYCSQNLWVDKNLDTLETLWRRAAKAGYTHVLLTDSKFSKLGDMDARYFRNVQRLKDLAAALKLELVPALFSIGYSNDLLWHDPNLIVFPSRGHSSCSATRLDACIGRGAPAAI